MAAEPIPVWLDCDPGHDDAAAILLCGHNPAVRLLGVSTVAGNQTVERVTENALRVLAAGGLSHIDVVAGQSKPLMRKQPLLCPEIHGETGLDGPLGGPVLPPAAHAPLEGKAPVIMFERIAAAYASTGQRVRLVATGALTNVALLLLLYSQEVLGMIEVVLMGGALGIGNTGPVMEFNIQTDPEAAKIVFESGAQVTMVPLELTHTALVTTSVLQRIRTHRPTPFLNVMIDMLTFFAETYLEVFNFKDPPLHDPCAVAFVIAPQLFKCERLRVDVETSSELCSGQTVVDIWRQSTREKNVDVCMSMDVDAFWDMMVAAFHAADEASPLNSGEQQQQQQQ